MRITNKRENSYKGVLIINKYKTFFEYGEGEIVQKKSRFIGQAFYVSSEEDAQRILLETRKKQKLANHNCYAYRLEGATIMERQSDDGEPGGTAGMPILDILRGNEIVNGMVIVTRYFGGTLLGTGGLVKAYGSAAKQAVQAAGIITKELYRKISIFCDYTLSGKIEYELKTYNIAMDEIIYTDRVEFRIYIPLGEDDAYVKKMVDLTASKAEIAKTGEVYGGIIDNKFRLL